MNVIQRQFFALHDGHMPEQITLAELTYKRVETFKHDFFAATGLYRHEHDRVVVKIYRYRRFFGLPMTWAGRLQAGHEVRLYQRLDNLEGIPHCIGTIERTGFAHEYIPGQPLRRSSRVSDAFFDQLEQLVEQIHAHNIAYVDLNKSENILLGEDGRPYLIDFQISYAPRLMFFASKWILRRLQREDRYHINKHKRRIRPDLMTDQELADTYKRSSAIRIHRALTRPYSIVRRRVMSWLGLKSAE